MKEDTIHRRCARSEAFNGTWGIGGKKVAEAGKLAIPGKAAPAVATPKVPALRLKSAAESRRRTDTRELAFVAESPKPPTTGTPTDGSARRHKLS